MLSFVKRLSQILKNFKDNCDSQPFTYNYNHNNNNQTYSTSFEQIFCPILEYFLFKWKCGSHFRVSWEFYHYSLLLIYPLSPANESGITDFNSAHFQQGFDILLGFPVTLFSVSRFLIVFFTFYTCCPTSSIRLTTGKDFVVSRHFLHVN